MRSVMERRVEEYTSEKLRSGERKHYSGVGLYDGSETTKEGQVTCGCVVEIDLPILNRYYFLLDRRSRAAESLVHLLQAQGGEEDELRTLPPAELDEMSKSLGTLSLWELTDATWQCSNSTRSLRSPLSFRRCKPPKDPSSPTKYLSASSLLATLLSTPPRSSRAYQRTCRSDIDKVNSTGLLRYRTWRTTDGTCRHGLVRKDCTQNCREL